MTENPSLDAVLTIVSGHWRSRLLATAVEADLFTRLSGAPAVAEELGERLGFPMPGVRDFLLALRGLDLLESSGDRFHNAPVAERYLVRGRPEFVGGYISFCERELNPAWDGLAHTLRTGAPGNPAAAQENPYRSLYRDEQATDSFLDGMDMFNTAVALAIGAMDWSDYGSFVDVGGARGNLAHHVVSRNPHLSAVVFDLPQLAPAFARHMAACGAPDSISFRGGDFFTDRLPEADVVVFGHVLHNWGPRDRMRLLRNAYDAVRPGGAVFVYDPMVGDETAPLNAVLASLSMRVWSAGGHEYTVEQCREWLCEAGFRTEADGVTELGDDVLVIAHKDR